MSRLFLKLFGTFWLTTLLILAISIFMSFRLADDQTVRRLADPREIDADLREVMEQGGLAGLRDFVADSRNFPPGQTVYIVDRSGGELLRRPVPEFLEQRLDRIWGAIDRHERRGHGDRHRKRSRDWLPVLEANDGSRWLAIPGPLPPPRFGIFSNAASRWIVLLCAAVTSLVTFWWLSRSLTGPAARMSAAVERFAAGDLGARVGERGYSKDEIGELARQFDRMAADLDAEARLRRELFRNVSHELRAPLARLQIATELLERKPEEAPSQLARIRSEIETLDALTGQVLALARASQDESNDRPVALAAVIERVAENAGFEADVKGVLLDVQAELPAVTLRANESLLASAIENVVRNAIQATPGGGRVSLVAAAGDGRCTVTVADSGPGVPEAELERIFEPFYRLDTNRPGSGIGLAITARVLQQLGGSARAANAPGGGLVVTLAIPVA